MKYTKELHDELRDAVKQAKSLANFIRMDDLPQTITTMETLLDELDRLQQASRWIPVSERLPDDYRPVFIFDNTHLGVRIGHHVNSVPQWSTSGGMFYHDDSYQWITHWQPLPTPPEGE